MLGRKCRYRGLTKKHQDTLHLFIAKAMSGSEICYTYKWVQVIQVIQDF